MDADGVGRGNVAEIAPLQHVFFAVEAGRERPVLRVDGDDRPDVTIEKALIVVVAKLDELVAGAEFAGDGAQRRALPGRERRPRPQTGFARGRTVRGVQRVLQLAVEVGHPGHPLVHGGITDKEVVKRRQRCTLYKVNMRLIKTGN